MIILTGNLSKRHQELNKKIAEGSQGDINFDEFILESEKSDVCKILKIGIASKYEKIDYIMETMKSGDSLHITKALNCLWIYDDKYSALISPDYLDTNIFPFMSSKMKKKLLSTISVHVRDELRAENFYKYCRMNKLNKIAYKFLNLTTNEVKLHFIEHEMPHCDFKDQVESKYLKSFIGSSFVLAEAYIQKCSEWQQKSILHKMRYLYSVSDVEYLDMLERYCNIESPEYERLGIRISSLIMKNYKNRVLSKPLLYLNILTTKTVVKHSKAHDAEIYAIALLPHRVEEFWAKNTFMTYKYVLDLLPITERYEFGRSLFINKYPGEEFEMSRQFYDKHYFDFMTMEEREIWALRHLDTNEELLGRGKDYLWCRYINFTKAFVMMKKYIILTPNREIRVNMVETLIDSLRNQRDLETLLKYYFERHINENVEDKSRFLRKIIDSNDIYKLDEDCWNAFDKLLYSVETYSTTGHNNCDERFRFVALVYLIVHDKFIPEGLITFIDSYLSTYRLKRESEKLTKEKEEFVFQYMVQFYIDRLQQFDGKRYDNIKEHANRYLSNIFDLYCNYNKPKYVYPEIVVKYAKLDYHTFRWWLEEQEETWSCTENNLMRILKKDENLLISKLPLIGENIIDRYSRRFRLNKLLRKLRIYFSEDKAKDFLNFFMEFLTKSTLTLRVAYHAINGIVQLSGQNFTIEIMNKYVPTDPKIDRSKIDTNLLYIQEAICRFAFYSRPPIPLTNILTYLKGDYVHFCLPMFNFYMSNLQPLPCLEFVKSTLDAPLSLQKHALRLLFECYDVENLIKVILDTWKKTKNVSLRMLLYQKMFDKLINTEGNDQLKIYEVLKIFTSNLHEDDTDEVFSLITSNKIPERFRGEYLECAWECIKNLPEKPLNWERRAKLIDQINFNMRFVKEEILRDIVDEHVQSMLIEKKIRPSYDKHEMQFLNDVKWNLVAAYVVDFHDEEHLKGKMALLQSIVKKCFDLWNDVHLVHNRNIFTIRKFCYHFVRLIEDCVYHKRDHYKQLNLLFESLLELFQERFALEEIYLTLFNLKLGIIAREVVVDARTNKRNAEEIGSNFAIKLGTLVKECVAKKQYYMSLENEIIDSITANISLIESFDHYIFEGKNLVTIVALELTNFEIPEINLLVLKMLPSDCPTNYWLQYECIIHRMKLCDDNNIRSYIHKKFVSDFIKRDFVK